MKGSVLHKQKVEDLVSSLRDDGCEVMMIVVQMTKEQHQMWIAGTSRGQIFLRDNPSLPQQFQEFCTDVDPGHKLLDQVNVETFRGDEDLECNDSGMADQDTDIDKDVEFHDAVDNVHTVSKDSNPQHRYCTRSRKRTSSQIGSSDKMESKEYQDERIEECQDSGNDKDEVQTNDIELVESPCNLDNPNISCVAMQSCKGVALPKQCTDSQKYTDNEPYCEVIALSNQHNNSQKYTDHELSGNSEGVALLKQHNNDQKYTDNELNCEEGALPKQHNDSTKCTDNEPNCLRVALPKRYTDSQRNTDNVVNCEGVALPKQHNDAWQYTDNKHNSDDISENIKSNIVSVIDYLKQVCDIQGNYENVKGKHRKCSLNDSYSDGVSQDLAQEEAVNKCGQTESCNPSFGFTAQVIQMYDHMLQGQMDSNVCLICNKTLNSSLMRHFQLHQKFFEKTRIKTCELCNVMLPSPYFDYHTCTQKGGLDNVNVSVNDIWKDILLFETKVLFTKTRQLLVCSVCNTQLNTATQYRKHLVQMHLFKYNCTQCSETKGCHSDMVSHLKQHSALPCLVCQKLFYQKKALMRHMRKNHRDRMPKYSCTNCKRLFTSQARLIQHKKIHIRTVSCTEEACDEVFHLQSELEEHKIKFHRSLADRLRPFLCNICGQRFLRKGNLTAHQDWKHKIGTPEKCQVCGKEFPGRTSLSSHMKSHTTSLDYMCELCGVSYKQRSGLFLHRKFNHGDPNLAKEKFKCEVCLKEFTRKRSFQHHVVANGHKTENQLIDEKHIFRCKTCGKLFGDKERWERHSLVHSSKAVFKCTQCEKGFKDRSNLQKHMMMHNGSKPHCEICKRTFRSLKQLKEHKSTNHASSEAASDPQDTFGLKGVSCPKEMGPSQAMEEIPSVVSPDKIILSTIPHVEEESSGSQNTQDSVSHLQYANNTKMLDFVEVERKVVEASLAADDRISHVETSGCRESTRMEDTGLVYQEDGCSVEDGSSVVMETTAATYMLLPGTAPTASLKERVVPWYKC